MTKVTKQARIGGRKLALLAVGIFAAGAVLPVNAVVSPFGDSVFWWRGGRDGANGCAQDGLLTQGELVDVRHAKDTTFWNQSYSTLTKDGSANNTLMPYQTETVTAPYACESYTASTLYFPQTFTVTTNYSGTGEATEIRWRAQQISRLYLPKMFRDSCVNGTCPNWTAFIRFRRDGLDWKPNISADSLMLFNFNWSSKQGIGINFIPTDTTQKSAELRLSIGNHQPKPGLTVTRGQWVDLAISVAGKVVNVFWCAQNGKFGLATYDETSNANVGDLAMSATSYIHVGTDLNLAYNSDCLVYDVATQKGTSSNNAIMAFRGAIAQLAFWDRALDAYEVQQVFGYPRPAAMTAGIKDNSTNEYLSVATSVASGCGNWEEMSPALVAGQSRMVRFSLTEPKASLPQLLRIFPAAGSASGRLSVTLNGNSVVSASFDGTRTFQQFVKAASFVTGENTLTVTRTDSGTGDILIDAMEMSGSFMVGRDSHSNNVFSHEDNNKTIFDYDMACGMETNLVAGLNVRKTYDCRLSVTFPLDAETLRAASGMSYRTFIATYSSGTGYPPSRFAINGHVIKEYATDEFPAAYQYLGDFFIPVEHLRAGTNTFTFTADYVGGNTSIWRGFSFHRFELLPVESGTMILFR